MDHKLATALGAMKNLVAQGKSPETALRLTVRGFAVSAMALTEAYYSGK